MVGLGVKCVLDSIDESIYLENVHKRTASPGSQNRKAINSQRNIMIFSKGQSDTSF